MRIAVVFFVSLYLLFSDTFATDVTVGVFVHAPLVQQITKTSEPSGPTIDYITAVLKEMGYTPVISILPLRRILAGLQSGDIDITLEIGISAERKTYLYYPNKPIYISKPSITVLATNKLICINSIDDLRGMRIGYLAGAELGGFFRNAPDVKFELISGDTWLRQNLEKLLAGRIDAAFDQNNVSYLDEAKKMGIVDKIKTIPLPGTGNEGYIVFSKKSPIGKDLVDAFNRVAATGKYDENKIIDDYMKR
ncbi:MAG: substrate-binding periplasmic protein [Fibrobacterota bacterium]|nr:transporter substrate-binding domain-containing protein [Chitinispirillaceae bacterium]